MRRPELFFDFPARYELQILDRINRSFSSRAFLYPGAHPVDPQQELADRPILGVRAADGQTWIGVFTGGTTPPPVSIPTRVVGMPDEVSFCVVYSGGATIVRSDDPAATTEVDLEPLTGLLVVAERRLVVFAGSYGAVAAYGADGRLWDAHVLTDDIEIAGVEGNRLSVVGFEAGDRRHVVELDLATGAVLSP